MFSAVTLLFSCSPGRNGEGVCAPGVSDHKGDDAPRAQDVHTIGISCAELDVVTATNGTKPNLHKTAKSNQEKHVSCRAIELKMNSIK